MHYINHYNSPLGKITFASNGKELTGLWFNGQKYFASTLTKEYEQKICLFLNRQQNGLIFILAAKIPILRRRYIYRQLSFAMKCGKFCSQFRTAV